MTASGYPPPLRAGGSIRGQAAVHRQSDAIEEGRLPAEDNPLKNAPHTAASLLSGEWAHGYSRETAAYPVASLRRAKYWSPVGRVDNVWGDRNLSCSCPPMADYA